MIVAESHGGDALFPEILAIEDQPFLVFDLAGEHGGIYHLQSAFLLKNGNIVLLHAGGQELLFLEPNGRIIVGIGNTGQGPGEFERLQGIAFTAGDTVLAYSPLQRKVLLYTSSGRFAREVGIATADNESLLVGAHEDYLLLRRSSWHGTNQPGPISRTVTVTARSLLDGSVTDTLGTFDAGPGYRTRELGGVLHPFGPRFYTSSQNGHLVAASSASYEFHRFDLISGKRYLNRHMKQPISFTRALIQDYTNVLLAAQRSDADTAATRSYLSQMQWPDHVPAFSAVMSDANGWIWVCEGFELRYGGDCWKVFDGDGRPVGRVNSPEGLRIRYIGSDVVLGSITDSLGLESIALHSLRRTTDVR